MGYFPNGSSGDAYMEAYCLKCVNWIDQDDGRGAGCPIMDVHLRFNYELCNNKTSPGKIILDALIPMDKDGIFNEKCSMFLPAYN